MNSATLNEEYYNISISQLIRAGILELPITKVDMRLNNVKEHTFDFTGLETENSDSGLEDQKLHNQPDLVQGYEGNFTINPRIHYVFIDNYEIDPYEPDEDKKIWPYANDALDLSISYLQSIMFNGLNNSKVLFVSQLYDTSDKGLQHFQRLRNSKTIGKLKAAVGESAVFHEQNNVLHSDKIQFNKFRSKQTKNGCYIIDLKNLNSAEFRGLDVENLDAIVLQQVPERIQDLIHVSGRVARGEFDRGICICLVNDAHGIKVKNRFIELLEQVHGEQASGEFAEG